MGETDRKPSIRPMRENKKSPSISGAFTLIPNTAQENSYPTRIRTWTNRTKICCATVTLSGTESGDAV